MQIYYMNKKGVPIGIGTSGISMKFIANQLMTVLMASALWLWNASFVDRQLAGARWVVVIGWLINFAAVPLILLVAFHRRWCSALPPCPKRGSQRRTLSSPIRRNSKRLWATT